MPIFLLVFTAYLLSSCNVKRRLGADQYLLVSNTIEAHEAKLDTEPVYSFIRQKPNRKLLLFRFHAGMYELGRRIEPSDQKKEKINAKRKEKEKKPRKFAISGGLKNIGEAPVILDTAIVNRSLIQMERYMRNKGYFHSRANASVKYRRKKAYVTYNLYPGKPYTFRNINHQTDDPDLMFYIKQDSANSLVKMGQNFDVESLENERVRLATLFRNRGYFYFNKDFISFLADTTQTPYHVDVTLGIKPPSGLTTASSDSTKNKHQQYLINNIIVNSDFVPMRSDTSRHDSLYFGNLTYLYRDHNRYNPKIIERAILFRKNQVYRLENHEATYKRLADLRGFKYINIVMQPSTISETDAFGREFLDCYIHLTPLQNQSYSFETEGTNSSGNMGISGAFVYQHRNLFKGFENFNFRVKTALEFQQATIEEIQESGEIIKNLPFNTYEYGVEGGLRLPRFLVPFLDPGFVPRNVEPKTHISLGYNYQVRPEFWRTISNLTFGYEWKYGKKQTHLFNPVEFNIVRLNKDSLFGEMLRKINDPLIYQSYQDHLTTGSQYSFVYNTQDLKRKKNYFYSRFTLDVAGNTLNGLNKAINADTANDGSYRLMQIRYAQYTRSILDLRYYFQQQHSSQVVRLYGGVGFAYGNRKVLPFEKTFFAGGANDIRGWKMQGLGPGSLPDSLNQSLYRRGDMILEANFEHRFDVYKFFKMAFFVDAGNIWNLKNEPEKPGADFSKDRFLTEVAISSGLGLRFDFSFFIIRLDAAIPVRNPALPEKERWQFDQIRMKKVNFNLGIGYPF